MKTCSKCKREVEDDMQYCPYCGTPFSSKSEGSARKDESKHQGIAIGTAAIIMLGIVLVIAGMLSHWLISVVGGIFLGTAWSIYNYFLKK